MALGGAWIGPSPALVYRILMSPATSTCPSLSGLPRVESFISLLYRGALCKLGFTCQPGQQTSGIASRPWAAASPQLERLGYDSVYPRAAIKFINQPINQHVAFWVVLKAKYQASNHPQNTLNQIHLASHLPSTTAALPGMLGSGCNSFSPRASVFVVAVCNSARFVSLLS